MKQFNIYAIIIISFIHLFLFMSCDRETSYQLKLDMSREHDLLRFLPEKGDCVFAILSYQQGKALEIELMDFDQDWIYSGKLGKYQIISDSVKLAFYYISGKDTVHEAIAPRFLKSIKILNKTIFKFNEQYHGNDTHEVCFTVNMNNQKVLDFFQPEKGDQVIVSGNFCDWDENGFLLFDKDDDGKYSVCLPEDIFEQGTIEYRYRILTKRDVVQQNGGWENILPRACYLNKESVNKFQDVFDNKLRVIKFVINTNKIKTSNGIDSSDIETLNIKLALDSLISKTDNLMKVSSNQYETAVMIPLNVKNIAWQLILNNHQELTSFQNIEVGPDGRVIEY